MPPAPFRGQKPPGLALLVWAWGFHGIVWASTEALRIAPMPDEFPTLEAVAALATLAAFVRAVQVSAALGEIRKLSAEVVLALGSGDRETLRRVSEESEG